MKIDTFRSIMLFCVQMFLLQHHDNQRASGNRLLLFCVASVNRIITFAESGFAAILNASMTSLKGNRCETKCSSLSVRRGSASRTLFNSSGYPIDVLIVISLNSIVERSNGTALR